MAALILPQRFASQPQYPAPIDWSNPITSGLEWVSNIPGRPQPSNYGPALTATAVLGVEAKSAGLSTRFTGTGSPYADSAGAIGQASIGTVLVMHLSTVLPPNAPTYCHVLASTAGPLTGNGWLLMLGNGSGALQFRMYAATNGASAAAADGTVALNDGKPHVSVATWQTASAGSIATYVDGVFTASGTLATATTIGQTIRVGHTRDTFWGALDGNIFLTATWTRNLSAAEIAQISSNPWQIFKAPPRKLWLPPAAVQLLRPGSDITAGTWTPSTGVNLFATLNETVASDATFDLTSQASIFEVGMTAGTSPGVTTGHVVRYRIVGAVTVSLRQGTTTIASWAQSPTAMTTYVQTLTSLQAAAITNYAALSLQFQAT